MVPKGTKVLLNVTPDAGYEKVEIYLNGAQKNYTTFVIDEDTVISVTVKPSGGEAGSGSGSGISSGTITLTVAQNVSMEVVSQGSFAVTCAALNMSAQAFDGQIEFNASKLITSLTTSPAGANTEVLYSSNSADVLVSSGGTVTIDPASGDSSITISITVNATMDGYTFEPVTETCTINISVSDAGAP